MANLQKAPQVKKAIEQTTVQSDPKQNPLAKPSKAMKPLQVLVPEDIKQKFKLTAVQNNQKMGDLFMDMYNFYMEHHK